MEASGISFDLQLPNQQRSRLSVLNRNREAQERLPIMLNQFETELYDLVNTEKVRVADHRFGHNQHGELDVWIECHPAGERFLSQVIVHGETYPIRQGVYSTKCYILREKVTGNYWFLDRNACGFWMQTDAFFGAKTFVGEESAKIHTWLTQAR